MACALAFTGVFLVSLHTVRGLRVDRVSFLRISGSAPLPFKVAGERTLQTIDVATLVAAVVVLAVLALARGRIGRAVVGAAVVGLSVGTAELLKHVLPRVAHALPAGRAATFPSGHTAVAASVALAFVIASPPLLRPAAALAGAAYAGAIGYAVVLLGWHYPSDSIASFFVCGFWAAALAALLPDVRGRLRVSPASVAAAAAAMAVALVLSVVAASQHPLALAAARSRPALVAAALAYGVLALLVVGFVAVVVEEPVEISGSRQM